MAYDPNARRRERYTTDPEYRETHSARHRKQYTDPEYRKAQRIRQQTPEYKARRLEYARKRYADPKWRAKENERRRARRARSTDPEYRAKKAIEAAKRNAAKLQRTPAWLTDKHRKEIAATYKLAAQITARTGIAHHVDHILPLRGKDISGLHVPSNLQILTATENLSKGNRTS